MSNDVVRRSAGHMYVGEFARNVIDLSKDYCIFGVPYLARLSDDP